jgi:5-methylphenazine-1-carboxylate 1-monooxygenase
MYPVGSNGASQAILDTRVLARELALQPSVEQAIDAYEAQRRLQTAEVVLANRGGGPERCIDIVERRAPNGFVNLDAVISREELEEISRGYKRIAGFDPRILNDRPVADGPPRAATTIDGGSLMYVHPRTGAIGRLRSRPRARRSG